MKVRERVVLIDYAEARRSGRIPEGVKTGVIQALASREPFTVLVD